ncbi:Hypothetical predicted protein, partial [Mytilus galloprovincialis]
INECWLKRDKCAQYCINTIGSFSCKCSIGYNLASDGKSCNDNNECSINNGGCTQNCLNVNGSYKCFCKAGFYLASDGKSCE